MAIQAHKHVGISTLPDRDGLGETSPGTTRASVGTPLANGGSKSSRKRSTRDIKKDLGERFTEVSKVRLAWIEA